MEEVKKWSVTYTKHLKQKRKVYQDGFLELHPSTNKVMLYDDCEKLLECRLLKKEEVVDSGEALTFNAYLVDVGDPEGDHKPIPNLTLRERDKKIGKIPRNLQGQFKSRKFAIPSGNQRTFTGNKREQSKSLSPSQKIIREFKKRELHKYGIAKSSPDSPKLNTAEWQVLYTTQLTQKAKKYHDGFLQLATSGSFGRQVMLFDEGRKLLESRFLKKDEAIRAGESILFDAFLVEIGELRETDDRHCDIVGELKTIHKLQNNIAKKEIAEKEWKVTYTNNLTQKAKKYHDGFLKLAVCGFERKKVLLFDTSKNLLDSRFLKHEEDIRPGGSIALDAHLVDIGEPEAKHELTNLNAQGNIYQGVVKTGATNRQLNFLAAKNSAVNGKPPNTAHAVEGTISGSSFHSVEEKILINEVTTKKPLRNANQILSILQKPRDQVDTCTDKTSALSTSPCPQVLNASPKNSQLPSSVLHKKSSKDLGLERSCEILKIEKSPELDSKASSTADGGQYSKDAESGNSQLKSDNPEGKTEGSAKALGSGTPTSSVYVSENDLDQGFKSFNEGKSKKEVDACPSFDLGF